MRRYSISFLCEADAVTKVGTAQTIEGVLAEDMIDAAREANYIMRKPGWRIISIVEEGNVGA